MMILEQYGKQCHQPTIVFKIELLLLSITVFIQKNNIDEK